MIPARDTKPRWVVSLKDDALSEFENSVIREYSETRDINVLGIDTKTGIVSMNGKMATLFLIEPLKHQYAHLADPELQDQHAMTSIFATHVKDARNSDMEIERDGDRIKPVFLEKTPLSLMNEISSVIIELATDGGRGVSIPFSLPAGYWRERLNMRQMLARSVSALTANQDSGTDKTELES